MKKIILCISMVIMILSCGIVFACESPSSTVDEPLMGGWNETDSPEVPQHILEIFNKATNGMVGVGYKPVAYLGYQVVDGKNHCILCQAKVVYPNSRPYYALVYVYEDLKGNATISNIVKLDIAELNR